MKKLILLAALALTGCQTYENPADWVASMGGDTNVMSLQERIAQKKQEIEKIDFSYTPQDVINVYNYKDSRHLNAYCKQVTVESPDSVALGLTCNDLGAIGYAGNGVRQYYFYNNKMEKFAK